MKAICVRLYSDNFDGSLLTVDAYEELVLQMSTGDHATHTARYIEIDVNDNEYLEDLICMEDIIN